MKRRWLFRLLLIAFLWIVVTRFTEIEKLIRTLSQGKWQWVLAAALLQLIYYIVYAALYHTAFYTVEVESHIWDLVPVTLGSIFVNVAAPSGGASAAALFVDDAARRGQSPARAAAGTLLVLVADFTAFTLVLAFGLAHLFLLHDLTVYEIIGAVALMLMITTLTGVLLLGLWQPDRLRRLLTRVQQLLTRLGGWLRRPTLLGESWAETHAAEFTQAAIAITAHPGRLAWTMAVALAAHLVNLASLYTLFLAFHQPVKVGPLVAGFSVGILFLIVSPIPMGVGVVEGVMPLVYISLNVPAEAATIITLAFRGLSFWLPFAIGFLLLRRVKAFGGKGHS